MGILRRVWVVWFCVFLGGIARAAVGDIDYSYSGSLESGGGTVNFVIDIHKGTADAEYSITLTLSGSGAVGDGMGGVSSPPFSNSWNSPTAGVQLQVLEADQATPTGAGYMTSAEGNVGQPYQPSGSSGELTLENPWPVAVSVQLRQNGETFATQVIPAGGSWTGNVTAPGAGPINVIFTGGGITEDGVVTGNPEDSYSFVYTGIKLDPTTPDFSSPGVSVTGGTSTGGATAPVWQSPVGGSTGGVSNAVYQEGVNKLIAAIGTGGGTGTGGEGMGEEIVDGLKGFAVTGTGDDGDDFDENAADGHVTATGAILGQVDSAVGLVNVDLPALPSFSASSRIYEYEVDVDLYGKTIPLGYDFTEWSTWIEIFRSMIGFGLVFLMIRKGAEVLRSAFAG